MPRISLFHGISIYMYFRDHAPPHFHAIHGEFEAEIEITSGHILVGDLPRRAKQLVEQWTLLHGDELSDNWERATQGFPLDPIDPLP